MESCCCDCKEESASATWLRAAGMVLFVVIAYLILKGTGLFSLTSAVGDVVGLGSVFVIGLIAATSSCLAVVGGLLLAALAYSWVPWK